LIAHSPQARRAVEEQHASYAQVAGFAAGESCPRALDMGDFFAFSG
jgi:hypothetical protein